jgi:hypothetical protein
MGKHGTGNKDSDSPTKEMYAWRNNCGAFLRFFKKLFENCKGVSSIKCVFHFSLPHLFRMCFVLINKTCSELRHAHSRFTGRGFPCLVPDGLYVSIVITFAYNYYVKYSEITFRTK